MVLHPQVERDIEHITDEIVRMGKMVGESVLESVRALTERNDDLAHHVILRDRLIDEKEVELDSQCVEFMATRQPAAADVRFIYSASRIVNELERIGDYAETIARHALVLNQSEAFKEYIDLPKMAKQGAAMLESALGAFSKKDAQLAESTMHQDNEIDRLQEAIYRELIELSTGKPIQEFQKIISILIVASKLERIGDQVCNICEEVIYEATGELIKHEQKRRPHVLFLCIGNSVRSQMAEAYFQHSAGDHFVVSSAGIRPTAIHPLTTQVLKEDGIDISHKEARIISEEDLSTVQIVITLCHEAEVECPKLPFKTNVFHWNIEDPIKQGAGDLAAFRKVRDTIKKKITEFIKVLSS